MSIENGLECVTREKNTQLGKRDDIQENDLQASKDRSMVHYTSKELFMSKKSRASFIEAKYLRPTTLRLPGMFFHKRGSLRAACALFAVIFLSLAPILSPARQA